MPFLKEEEMQLLCSRYHDIAKTTCGIRQSNYLPLLLYHIPLIGVVTKAGLTNLIEVVTKAGKLVKPALVTTSIK
jgi:hypothetical protein